MMIRRRRRRVCLRCTHTHDPCWVTSHQLLCSDYHHHHHHGHNHHHDYHGIITSIIIITHYNHNHHCHYHYHHHHHTILIIHIIAWVVVPILQLVGLLLEKWDIGGKGGWIGWVASALEAGACNSLQIAPLLPLLLLLHHFLHHRTVYCAVLQARKYLKRERYSTWAVQMHHHHHHLILYRQHNHHRPRHQYFCNRKYIAEDLSRCTDQLFPPLLQLRLQRSLLLVAQVWSMQQIAGCPSMKYAKYQVSWGETFNVLLTCLKQRR